MGRTDAGEGGRSFHELVFRIISGVREFKERLAEGEDVPDDLVEKTEEDFDALVMEAVKFETYRGRNLEALKAQEEERRRIARELHDGPVQLLAGLVRRMEILEKLIERDPERFMSELAETKRIIRTGLRDLRVMLTDLRPPVLDLGLVAAVTQLIGRFESLGGPRIDLDLDGRFDSVPPDVELALYRIIQEALSNVWKHASAERVAVRGRMDGIGATIEVEDDGSGMREILADRELLEKKKLGIIGMQERTEIVGGTISFGEGPMGGTIVRVGIPLGSIENSD